MQPVGSKSSLSGKISSELAPQSKTTRGFHVYDVSVKYDRRHKICDLNPLFPEAAPHFTFQLTEPHMKN